jgi:hypothetical protein
MDEKPTSESHATLRKPGSCRVTGEELLGKQPLPLGDQVQQLAGAAQQLLALRAAELLRGHGPEEAVAVGAGIPLLDLLTAQGQRDGLRPQPAQKRPDRAVVQAPLFLGGRVGRLLIAGGPPSGAGGLAVGLLVVLDVAAGQVQEGRSGVALIGEYESRGNR